MDQMDQPTSQPPKSDRPGLLQRCRLFGQTVVRSCYDMDFYRQVREGRWSQGLTYFLKLMVLITVVTAMFLAPTILSGLGQLREYIDSKVPDGATIEIDDGQLSTNLSQPLDIGSKDEPVVIDVSVTGMDFPRERVGANGLLIGRDAIFMRQDGSEERAYALKEFPEFSINKARALSWLERSVVPTAIVLTLLLSLFYFLGVSIGNLLFVLIGAALTQLFARLWRVRLDFRSALAMALYAITLPMAAGALFDSLGWHQVPVFPVVFFMIMAWAVADERTRQLGIAPESPSGPGTGPLLPPWGKPPGDDTPDEPPKPEPPPPSEEAGKGKESGDK